ncbi:5-formyltetrahydrofolate cyclo-ligase [Oceanospirillum multiglobuliferum]|uniref:5-formyltetrahydrofolate cyclo-ligase n=1 Tax=Oceanospirillum multiglobuliferum TaxID=64969 RepID=A0A1T4SDP9_9GAMM|nr:5-formyltetrahydrofolate cyclo-ligase [Oceanospirillum multiglobuliferum]OPX54329.1 5-formyltetrahydrofolate cyclo-ligase [Oceanospirillum multiglobuliferum]SKA26266.1 5-formyltetrahydrofolate cyclo-ligase [Oceanospirillum multiglobuliferum]
MTISTDLNQRNQLRRAMRHNRRALSPLQQKQAAERLFRLLIRQPFFLRAKRIALYLASDGEIDPQLLIQKAQQMGKTCYLPVLQPLVTNRLWFVRYDKRTPMGKNRFGISEPKIKNFGNRKQNRCTAKQLDLVLLPLVAFDPAGGRMGMGGGFYDRTFAFMRQHIAGKPVLVGLAHECQKVDKLPIASWDIPLHAVASDQALYVA